ncbi:DMT family transporter [Basilea psittacipulmonis]|uniref:Membrane protein n=3 Tax=Basilea TaxID=1472344 RepID=A0A077DHQ9_9BURK|nr:DMT family transporter [Basilea psittacipulmonis]AIL33087.1 membrane protein [Basilea psittacipulmonis DSM 24701]
MLYLLIAAFFWGTSFIAGKFAYTMADPALVVLFRLIIAGSIMLPISLRYWQQKTNIDTSIIWKIALLGFLTYPITFLLQFLGLSLTSASSAATVIGLEPLMVAIVGAIFFKEKITPSILFLSTLAFIGVTLVVSNDQAGTISVTGCALVLLSTVVVAFWLRLSQQILKQVDSKIYTALSIQLGTIIGLPLILLLVKDWNITYSANGVMAILYLGVGCSLIAGWCWNKGLNTTSANISGIFLALEPVFGVLLAVSLLNENLSYIAIIGVICVIVAAGISMFLQKK